MTLRLVSRNFETTWRANSVNVVYGRLTAPEGSGVAIPGEGCLVKQVDLEELTYTVTDDTTGEVVATDVVIDIATAIYDEVRNRPQNFQQDSRGYNFELSIPATSIPTKDHRYSARVRATTTGGNTSETEIAGPAI